MRLVLPFIEDGSKDLEIRLGHRIFREVKVGDTIIFNNRHGRKVTGIREYPTLEDALKTEDYRRIYPNPDTEQDALLAALREVLKGDVSRLGVLVFELQPI
ncbi:MAG: hypothetical protein WC675_04545 [Patescibacteria group bacterium]|jgi:ASC-1-like (ASCH) protein